MARLTYRDESGKAWAKLSTSVTAEESMKFGRLSLDRLAAYEDTTGLEPEEIRANLDASAKMVVELELYKALGDINHICDLLAAEKDGRCVVLPIPFGKGKEAYGIAEDDYDDEVPKSIVAIDCEELERVEIWPSGEMVVTVDGWEIGQSDIGKTVFLTPEEAEAKLKEGNDERD